MTSTNSVLFALGTSVALAACSGADTPQREPEPIDVQVANLDQVSGVLAQIERLQEIDANDPRATDALERLLPVIDRLNHLVARVEVGEDHFVSFYEPEPGNLLVSERGPFDDGRVLADLDLSNVRAVDLYQRLAGEEAPDALIEVDARRVASPRSGVTGGSLDSSAPELPGGPQAENVGTTAQALTAEDGPWWQDNVCFKSGDSRGCHPHWFNGGWAQQNAKTSFFSAAAFSGNQIQVRMQYRDNTAFSEAVFPGQWFSWWAHSDTVDWPCGFLVACGHDEYNNRKHRWDVLQATNDGFHWTYAFKWNCGSTLTCNQWPSQ